MDCRLPENRIEAFRRIAYVRMMEGDCDHHHVSKVITSEMNLDNDQKMLYALLFGHSYRNHWAMIIIQLFPNILEMDSNDIQEWHNKNWHRSMYSNDTKWNVRLFPRFIHSVKEWLKGDSLYERIASQVTSDSPETNFKNLDKVLSKFVSMGRMCKWLTIQTIYELFDFKLDYWNMQLLNDNTWSQYDALCYFFNRLDLSRQQCKPKREDKLLMEENCIKLLTYCNERLPFHLDIYNTESILCEARKTFYGPKIKEYTFWTSNELVMQYPSLVKLWEDYPHPINFQPYVIAFMCKGEKVRNYGFTKDYFRVVYDHGINLNTHYYFDDEINAYSMLNLIPPEHCNGFAEKMYSDWHTYFDPTRQCQLREKYNPKNFLRYK